MSFSPMLTITSLNQSNAIITTVKYDLVHILFRYMYTYWIGLLSRVIFWQVTEAEGARDSGKSPEDPPQVLLHADLPREAGYRTQRVHRTGQ